MSIFSAVGDFFRSPFEDDQEKKRRKLREQQEAQQRAAQKAAPKPQNRPAPNQTGLPVDNWFSMAKPSPQVPAAIASPAPLTAQTSLPKPNTPPTPATSPQPTQTPQAPQEEYLGGKLGEGKNKTIFGWNAAALLPKSLEKQHEVKANKPVKLSSQQFLEQFDKIDDSGGLKRAYVADLQKQAKENPLAAKTLKLLQDNGRMQGGVTEFVRGSNEKLYGGLLRGTARGADMLLPGHNTFGLERFADDQEGQKEFTKQGKRGETAGSVQKGIVDVATIAIPGSKVDKLAEETALARRLAEGGGFARTLGKAGSTLPGSLFGTGVDYLQTKGRGDDANLGKSAATGTAIDVGLGLIPGGLGRVLKRIKGEETIEDAAKLLEDDLIEALDDDVVERLKGATTEQEASQILEEAKTTKGEIPKPPTPLDEQAVKAVEDLRTETKAEIERIEKSTLAPQQKTAQKEAVMEKLKKTTEQLEANVAKSAANVDAVGAKTVQERAKIAVEDLRAETKAEMDRIDSSIATPEQKAVRKEAVMERLKKASDEIQANVAKSADEVDTAGAKAVAEQAARQDVVEEVQDAQKGAVEPGAKPVDGTEAAANDAYKTLDESLYKDAPGFEERGRSLGQTLSPDRVIRENITNPIENKLSELIGKAQVSDNSVARGVGRLFQGFSKEAGVSPELMQQKRLLRGGVEKGKMYRETIANLGNDVENASKTKVWSALDPEQAKKVGVEPADVSTFTPEELDYHNKLKEVIDITTKDLLDRGLITPAQAANGNYIKRAYSIFEDNSEVAKAYSESRQGFLNQFKKRKDVDKELLESAITDPSYLVAKKAAESQSAIAMVDYGDYLYNSGIAQDLPGAGRVQLPNSKLHGEAAGKWVPRGVAEDFTGFQYNIGMLNSFNDLVSAYDNLAIRKGKKGLLTVFNPAVRAGNQISNRVMFATMNGINPLQFNIAYQGVRGASKEASQLYREAVEQGLTGLDITQADFAKRIADGTGDVNLGKKALDWIKSSYSEADDRAKVAAYTVHRMRGYSPDDAARLTQRGFQDYNSVGFFYDLAAKTPLVGNAFVRFAADSMRIAKNTLVDHPLRTAGTIAAWATFVNGMSKLSGESAEDKATREGRFGAPKIPFTNISMAVQTPWGEVNAARFMPFYQLNDIGSPVSKFLPIAQNPLTPGGWQDPLLGQVGQALTDTDFRGKSIQDPENVKFADGTTKYQFDPLTDDQKKNNLLRFFFNQNVPLGREADTIKSAATGEKDIYGKDRSLMQALLRAGGLKVENYGAEQAKDTRATEEYFKRKEEIDKEVEGMTPQGQMAYRTLTGQYKLRDQKDNPFAPGETMDVKAPVYDFAENKYQEYMKNPELYDVMEKRAQTEAQANGAPLNPIFDPRLPREFRLQLIQQKSIAPGDNVELQERMYQSPNWDLYQDINDEYKAKAKAYYPQRDDENFDDEMLKHQNAPFPKKPQALKDSDAAYAAYLEGKAPKPEYTDAIKALKQQYNEQKWNWTNTERIARGLPLISWEEWDNKTFGFTPDNGKSGYGYGGGGGGGNNDWGKLGEISNTSIMDRLDAPEVAQLPALAKLLASAQGRKGGGRAKPKLGAASRGTG